MRTFLCFLWLIVPTLFAESFIQERRDLLQTIKLLHALGPKECLVEVDNPPGRLTSLPKQPHSKAAPIFFNEPKELDLLVQRKDIHQALTISYNSTFELFKKKIAHGHWNKDAFQNLMEHLNRQAKSDGVPVVSSELETLVKNFKLLDDFLTQQNFSRCAWEIVRNKILVVLDHLSRKTAQRKRHN